MIAKRKIVPAAREAFRRFATFLTLASIRGYVLLLSGSFQYAHDKRYFQEEMAVGF